MSSRSHWFAGAAFVSMLLVGASPVSAQLFGQPAPRQQQDYGQQQSDEPDPEVRVQQLETLLRKLTGQNEELQFRNRQLEEQIRQLQAGAPPAANTRPNVAAAAPRGPAPALRLTTWRQLAGCFPSGTCRPSPLFPRCTG